MKKQTKKAAKEKPVKKVVAKKKSTKAASQVSDAEPETEVKNELENAPSETEHIEQNQPLQLSAEDKRRLEFKFGARIDETDLSGTRAEVIYKVSQKTGESQEALTVMLNDSDFSG